MFPSFYRRLSFFGAPYLSASNFLLCPRVPCLPPFTFRVNKYTLALFPDFVFFILFPPLHSHIIRALLHVPTIPTPDSGRSALLAGRASSSYLFPSSYLVCVYPCHTRFTFSLSAHPILFVVAQPQLPARTQCMCIRVPVVDVLLYIILFLDDARGVIRA